MIQKHLRLPEDIQEILAKRDMTEFKTESTYVAAAIRQYAKVEKQKDLLQELVKIQQQLNEIYRIITNRNPADIENGIKYVKQSGDSFYGV